MSDALNERGYEGTRGTVACNNGDASCIPFDTASLLKLGT